MRTIAIACLVLAGLLGQALGAPGCAGTDLLARMRGEDPAAHARVKAALEEIPNGVGNYWRIEKPGVAPSHLFGTAHVTDERVTRFLDNIADALESSRVLLVELAPDQHDPEALAGALMAYALLPAGASLDDWLTPEDRELLAAVAGRHGLPWAAARVQRPGFLATTLTIPPCAKLAMMSEAGVMDQRIIAAALAAGLDIAGLETVDEQFRAIASLDNEIQLEALIQALRMGGGFAEDLYETTIALYAAQMIGAIGPLLSELGGAMPAAAAANQDAANALVVPRNRLMFERARPEVDEGGAFIAVGALHLSGETGLVALFRDAGYTLTRIP